MAHARGKVLFLCGAGISRPAGLPDFRGLVSQVYALVDINIHAVISKIPREACNSWDPKDAHLTPSRRAEIRRFIAGDFDVVLGMLERRMDTAPHIQSLVREKVIERLSNQSYKHTAIHRALIRLADRGRATTIVTTNFDLLLEQAASKLGQSVRSFALGSIPRPTRHTDFSGVHHIHGALGYPSPQAELVLTDRDFGEYYLRRRVVPDYIYDAARLFHLVLVGYSANDPPMRYLLNAVAADGTRFDDLKERFSFVGSPASNDIALADWKERGITPIAYNEANDHASLLRTLERWAEIAALTETPQQLNSTIRAIVKNRRSNSPQSDRDLFDHLIRRSSKSERRRIAAVATTFKAHTSWLDAILDVEREPQEVGR